MAFFEDLITPEWAAWSAKQYAARHWLYGAKPFSNRLLMLATGGAKPPGPVREARQTSENIAHDIYCLFAGGPANLAHRRTELDHTARFRAMLMTSFAFILGVALLVVASGAGAGARKSTGITVFSGMLASTCLPVLFVPSIFCVVQRFEEWRVGRKRPRIHAAA